MGTPTFLELALLDSLSYDVATNEGGPDGSIIKAVMNSKETDAHTKALQECAVVLKDAQKNLKRLSSITIADAVALAGAEAVNAVGGPILPTQLGRMDSAAKAPVPASMPPLNLFTGEVGNDIVADTFRAAGKIGRMSDFKRLTDDDIEAELAKDGADDDEESYTVSGDDGWYIADTFGTADSRFGKSLTSDKPQLSAVFKTLSKTAAASPQYSWVGDLLTSKDVPTAQSWAQKYGSKPLLYEKDLKVAYNAATQLGGEFTGGKYENLLKNKKRKTLNDDELDFLR